MREEHPEVQRERMDLTRSKSPAELARISGIRDIPIPGLWTEHTLAKSEMKKHQKRFVLVGLTFRFRSIPFQFHLLFFSAEAEDAKKPSSGERPSSNLPSTLTRPCVVRSKVEDPELLRRRQEMQQSKSIHELSKISNVNEIPLPFKLPLPDIPLPTVAGIFSRKKKPKASLDATATPASVRAADFEGYSPSASPISPDRTEHELLG